MARKADDLLSIFDPKRQDAPPRSKGSAARGASRAGRRPARRGGKARAAAGAFEGLFLGPRQLLLVGSAGVLLLVLTFTIGLAVGRPGGQDVGGATLQREAGRADWVWVRGKVSRVDRRNQGRFDPREIKSVLAKEHRVRPEHIRIKADGEHFLVHLGPFRNRDQAERYVAAHRLDAAHINMGAPFHYRQIVPYQP